MTETKINITKWATTRQQDVELATTSSSPQFEGRKNSFAARRCHSHPHLLKNYYCKEEGNKETESTLNSLKLSSNIFFCGRENELKRQGEAFDRIRGGKRVFSSTTADLETNSLSSTSPSRSEDTEKLVGKLEEKEFNNGLILIHGHSGTGKTTLANKLKKPTENCGGIFVSGKFEVQRSLSEPYTAFSTAFKKVCDEICKLKRTNKSKFKEFKLRVRDAVGGSGGDDSLVPIIPNVIHLLTEDNDEEREEKKESDDKGYTSIIYEDDLYYDDGGIQKKRSTLTQNNSNRTHQQQGPNLKNKFHFLLRRFVRAICIRRSEPLVIVIDDMQWADSASLDLMENLLTDKQNEGLLLIGCYRDNELEQVNSFHHDNNNRPLSRWLRKMELHHDDDGCCLGDVEHNDKHDDDEPKEPGNKKNSINEIGKKKKDDVTTVNITKIHVSNLSVQSINEFLEDLLTSNISDTFQLASVVHSRTNGNIFFVIEFLKSLKDRNLLTYNIGLMKWTWNVNEILSKTSVTDNVAIFVKEKMIKLLSDNSSKEVLIMAACLGYTFESSTLIMVASILQKSNSGKEEAQKIFLNVHNTLSICNREGILESGSNAGDNDEKEGTYFSEFSLSDSYKFVHDQIHHATLSLISEDELDMLRCRIGNIMVEHMTKEELDENIFIAVNLLNNARRKESGNNDHSNDNIPALSIRNLINISSTTNKKTPDDPAITAINKTTTITTAAATDDATCKQHIENNDVNDNLTTKLIQLNLQAGKKAMQLSAFKISSVFLGTAIQYLLDGDSGDLRSGLNDTTLRHNLFSIAAQVEYCNGNFSLMSQYLNAVLKRDEISMEDKLDAYYTLLDSLCAQERYEEATDQSLFILSKLGAKFPKRNFKTATIRSFLQTKLLLRGKSRNKIMNLPGMEGANQIMSMKIMNVLISCIFFTKPDLMPLVIFKMVRWSIKFGISCYAPTAFNTYGLVLCSMQDFKEGIEYGNLAIALATRRFANVKEIQSGIISVYHSFIGHCILPLSSQITPFMSGYKIGMETGCIDQAMWNIFGYLWCSFNSGRSLHLVDKDMRIYVDEMKYYKQNAPLTAILAVWQFIMCLMGCVDDPTVLTGEAIDYDEFVKHLQETNNISSPESLLILRLMLAYYFGKYELAGKIINQFEKNKVYPSDYFLLRKLMFEGLTAYALARTKTKPRVIRRWMIHALKIQRKLKKWVAMGNTNCVHIVQLLQAEELAVLGKEEQALKKYKESIISSSRAGFLHDKALANERAGEFFLFFSTTDKNDKSQSAFHLETAHRQYLDWGAEGKAKQVLEKYH